MKNIINLMKLDLICIKKKTLIPMFVGVAVFALFGFFMGPLFMMPMILFSGLCVQSVFNIAAQNGFNKLYGVLPIKRSSVVYARFALGVLSVGIVTLVMVLLGTAAEHAALFKIFDEELANFWYSIQDDGFTVPMVGAVLFATSCALVSSQYAFVFVLGVERETLGTICGIIIALLVLLVISMANVEITTGAADMLSRIYQKSEYLLYAAIYLAGAVIAFFFALVTGEIMKRREL